MTKHVHLIGIGGSGLSAIARVLLERGYVVSGSDRIISPAARELKALGVCVYEGHNPSHIRGVDIVIRSSAVPDDNPEIQAARLSNIPVYKRSDFLGDLMSGQKGIAVAGSHGKTTTTAMIAWALTRLKLDPSYIIGGSSKNLGSNAHAGRGSAFVVEADEYDRMFLGLHPELIVVTNIDYDHPDCYPTRMLYQKAFIDFVACLKPGGILLTCLDDPGTAILSGKSPAGCKELAYALESKNKNTKFTASYITRDLSVNMSGGFSSSVYYQGTKLAIIALQVPGEHNMYNALGAFAAIHQLDLRDQLNISSDDIAMALSEYSGTERRFDIRGQICGITLVDDYAHHPTEIKITLAAARSLFPGHRLWVVWQPHTYSRLQALMNEFASAFDLADQVLITEIYAAREVNADFSASQIVAKMTHPNVHFIPSLEAVTQHLLTHLQSGDILLVLSAGDADKVNNQLMADLPLQQKEACYDN